MSILMNIEQIGFRYRVSQQNSAAIRNFSGTIHAGETLAICGPNGSGKSTLARLLTGLLAPDQGTINIGSQPLAQMSRRQLAQFVALVAPIMNGELNHNVDELVAMGRYPYLEALASLGKNDEVIVAAALATTGLTAHRYTPFHQLSSGQQQLVLLARAFAQQTPLLILDEPTAHLDVAHVRNLLQRLQEFKQQPSQQPRTIIIITHDLNLVCRYCDRVWLLKDGEKVADGPVAATLNETVLSAVFDCRLEIMQTANSPTPHLRFEV